jgi:hypothetical protein
MAKGLRATTRKRNRAKLRATIYGPAHDARTERLSAKLMEIAAKPRPVQEKAMEIDDTEAVTVEKRRGKGQGEFMKDISHLPYGMNGRLT